MRTNDGYFIRKCLDGDSSAFNYLVEKYKAGVYAHAYAKLLNFHDAEDIAQEVFIKAYEKLSTLKQWDNFSAWLYSITSNLCKMQRRSQANRPDREFVEDTDEEILDKPSIDAYQETQRYASLYSALEELPEAYRQVLSLYYLAGMRSKEISQFLGTSPNTIDKRLSRARSLLKEEILTMMTATFNEMRLQPSFTFRVVETIKQTKIQSPPSKAQLPIGVSAAAGLIVLLLSLTIPHSPLYPIGQLVGSALPSKTEVPEVGIIPVDTIEITEIVSLSIADGDFGKKPTPKLTEKAAGVGEWERREDMPKAKAFTPSVVISGKIYSVGGVIDHDVEIIKEVSVYDPSTDKWILKTDIPTKRFWHGASTINGKIYVIGGLKGGMNVVPHVDVYDPVMNIWEKGADIPTPRILPSTAVVDGKIYAIGGDAVVNGQWQSVPVVEAYDPMTDTWERKADMPTARKGMAIAVIDGKIYTIGGGSWNGAVGQFNWFAVVEVYDPQTDTWNAKTDIRTPRWLASASVVDGKIYVIGGVQGAQQPVLPNVEVYDTVLDVWTEGLALPRQRKGASVNALNGRIYVMGGYDGAKDLSTVEVYDTGFRAASVNLRDKLATTWSEVKAVR